MQNLRTSEVTNAVMLPISQLEYRRSRRHSMATPLLWAHWEGAYKLAAIAVLLYLTSILQSVMFHLPLQYLLLIIPTQIHVYKKCDVRGADGNQWPQ